MEGFFEECHAEDEVFFEEGVANFNPQISQNHADFFSIEKKHPIYFRMLFLFSVFYLWDVGDF